MEKIQNTNASMNEVSIGWRSFKILMRLKKKTNLLQRTKSKAICKWDVIGYPERF